MKKKSILITLIAVFIFYSFNGINQTINEFHLNYSDELTKNPISGRVILILSTDTLIDPDIPNAFRPFITFGIDFKDWSSDKKLILRNENVESFMSKMNELKGNYSIRAIIDTDTTSSRLLKDGIIFSDKNNINIESNKTNLINININQILTGFGYKNRKNIELIKLQSLLLSNFYNSPTFIEASVILPESYFKNPNKYYPTVYVIPGWGATHETVTQNNSQQKRYGMSGFGLEKIFVYLNHDCQYGYHGFADSDNNGPRAASFIQEFIPYFEKNYRVEKNPNSRFLIGQSSGAWAALWLQINYPDKFGMVWAGSPDPVDFRDFIGHNLYSTNANLFYDSIGNLTSAIRKKGKAFTNKDWSDMEIAVGGGQYQSFESVFGTKDENGKPEMFFDRETGKIIPEVIENWEKYDLNLIIQNGSEELKDNLKGKINIVVADNDEFLLDGSIKLLKETLDDLNYEANIRFLKSGGHNTWNDEIRKEMHEKMDEIYSNSVF